jgi:DNA-binding transcriptional LysR family regulator
MWPPTGDTGEYGRASDPLVELVLHRALELAHDLPARVEGRDPTTLIFFPSNRRIVLYHDLAAFLAAAEAGEVLDVDNAGWGVPPRLVRDWSEEQLRRWLADHPPPDWPAYVG